MANTRKEVLESNERYRKNFLNKNTRLHLINDYDLIQDDFSNYKTISHSEDGDIGNWNDFNKSNVKIQMQ